MSRRERTRQLIELGGLVAKAGVVELAKDDRAAIYGALLNVAGLLKDDQAPERLELWRRRGRRAFEAEANLKSTAAGSEPPGTE